MGGETDKTLKAQIVVALAQGGACKQLVDTMRAEKDPALKADGVQRLGQMHRVQGSDRLSDGADQQMKPLVLVFMAAVPLFAQPHLSNARMETRAVSGSLDATFRGDRECADVSSVDRLRCAADRRRPACAAGTATA